MRERRAGRSEDNTCCNWGHFKPADHALLAYKERPKDSIRTDSLDYPILANRLPAALMLGRPIDYRYGERLYSQSTTLPEQV